LFDERVDLLDLVITHTFTYSYIKFIETRDGNILGGMADIETSFGFKGSLHLAGDDCNVRVVDLFELLI